MNPWLPAYPTWTTPEAKDGEARDSARHAEMRRCADLVRRAIEDGQQGDWPAGRCCISRLEELLKKIEEG